MNEKKYSVSTIASCLISSIAIMVFFNWITFTTQKYLDNIFLESGTPWIGPLAWGLIMASVMIAFQKIFYIEKSSEALTRKMIVSIMIIGWILVFSLNGFGLRLHTEKMLYFNAIMTTTYLLSAVQGNRFAIAIASFVMGANLLVGNFPVSIPSLYVIYTNLCALTIAGIIFIDSISRRIAFIAIAMISSMIFLEMNLVIFPSIRIIGVVFMTPIASSTLYLFLSKFTEIVKEE